jgi:hypothetical protein
MAENETITDNNLALFRERAKTELAETGGIGRIAWDCVVEELCNEVERLRSVSKKCDDAAKLREALSDACYAMFNFLKTQNGGYEEMVNALDKAKAALAAPAINCEVGTVEEQSERFRAYCEAHKDNDAECLYCPLFGKTGGHCELAWAQMPYEAEKGGAK